MKLTAGQQSTLRAVCDTIIPSVSGPSPIYGRKASDFEVDEVLRQAIEETILPGPSESFARVLDVVESRAYNLLLTGAPSKFSDLDEEQREKYLRSWRDSRIPLKRTAFQALKRLTCFIAYTAVDGTGKNPNWADIGYPGPAGDTPAPVPDGLVLRPIEVDNPVTLECDVVVVGSGAGGSVVADAVSRAGFDVIVLEAGSYDNSQTFKQSELGMMQKLFQQGGTASTKDLSFLLLAGRGSGGGTTVNWNTSLKPKQRVLKEWDTVYGLHEVIGQGFANHLDEVWQGEHVNADESQRNPNNQALWDGCVALGYKEGTDFEVISRNVVGCQERCDYCTYGCIYGCKQSTALTFLPSAQSHGARFLFDTRVQTIEVQGGAARGVEATHVKDGREFHVSVRSKAVVAAAGGIETPALLLRSGVSDRNVGNYLTLDPTVAVGGVFPHKVSVWAGPPQTVAVWKFIDLDGSYHGFWVEAAPAHPGLFALSIPWLGGREHKDFMSKYYARSTASIILLRERSWGRVSIDGRGSPEVSYDLGREDRETLVRGMQETARILAAAGAVRMWTTHNAGISAGDEAGPIRLAELERFSEEIRKAGVSYNRMMLYSAHIMGSCRMSADPNKGPTAPSGELHTVKNLYIGDACVFPTTPAVNPMITIMAMARMTAESIITSLKAMK